MTEARWRERCAEQLERRQREAEERRNELKRQPARITQAALEVHEFVPWENQMKGCACGEQVRMAEMKNQLWRCWSDAKDGMSGSSPNTNATRHGKQAAGRKMIRHKLK